MTKYCLPTHLSNSRPDIHRPRGFFEVALGKNDAKETEVTPHTRPAWSYMVCLRLAGLYLVGGISCRLWCFVCRSCAKDAKRFGMRLGTVKWVKFDVFKTEAMALHILRYDLAKSDYRASSLR